MIPVTVPTTPLTVASFAAAPVQIPFDFCRQPRDHHSCPNFDHLCCRRWHPRSRPAELLRQNSTSVPRLRLIAPQYTAPERGRTRSKSDRHRVDAWTKRVVTEREEQYGEHAVIYPLLPPCVVTPRWRCVASLVRVRGTAESDGSEMAVPAGKTCVAWVDGVVLYRDDVERLVRLMTEHLPEQLRVISVRYKGSRHPVHLRPRLEGPTSAAV